MSFKRFAVIGAFALVAAPLFADTFVIDKVHSEATFKVRHMMSKVSGKFDDFGGTISVDPQKPAEGKVEFTMKAASIDTGVADRDKHLRSADFFDVEKNPEITFKSVSIKPSAKKNVYDVVGDLTMHGVTKRVSLPVELLGMEKDPWGNQRAGFSLETTLNRKDYGINWNQALDNGGFLVGDDVDISINIEAVKKPEPAPATGSK